MKRLPLVLAWLVASGCGAVPLEPRFAPPATPTEAMVAENISRAEARNERPVAVGVTADPQTLCAWDLTGGLLWERPIQARSAPIVVGDAVVTHEADGIVVRDLASGEARVVVDDEGELVGADAVGDVVVVSIAYKDGTPRGTVAFVDGSSVRWEKTLSQPVGNPALVENQVLVPWGTQRLSVLSAQDGAELARWNFRNLMLGHALVDRGNVYVGQHGWARVEKDLPAHLEGPLTLTAPLKRSLPGQPNALRDGYAAVPEPDNALHKVKLEWRPSGGTAGIEDDLVVFRFYRLVFGLSAQSDEVRWVRMFERDIVGAASQPGGVYLADDAGNLRFVDSAGNTRLLRQLGKQLRVISLRPGALVPTAEPQQQALEAPAGSLHDQLLAAARAVDDRLFAARAFAVQHLSRTSDPSVTSELIAMCAQRTGVTDAAQLAACDALAQRAPGGREVLEALRQKASFLEGTTAPPVGALAAAAARLQLKQAAPLLLSHAEDPHTSATDLVQLFDALAALQHPAAVPQLERFVRLHHAEPAGSELGPAVLAALTALGDLRAKAVRPTLANIADDGLSLEPVRQKAKQALSVIDTPPAAKAEEAKAGAAPAAREPPAVEEVQTDPRPYALDAQAVEKAFRPLYAALSRCLDADITKARSARIALIVAGDGSVEGFRVTPTTVQACAEPVLRNARFPSTRLGRQHVLHTVHAGEAAKPAAPSK